MPESLLTATITPLVILLVAICVLLFLKGYLSSKQIDTSDLEESSAKGHRLIYQALKKAQAILGMAELESIKVVADSRVSTRKMESSLEEQLSEIKSELEKNLGSQTLKAQEAFITYLSDLKTRSEQSLLQNQEVIQQKTQGLFDLFEQNLSSFLTQTEQKSVAAIELELKAARQLIDTYKAQQLSLVDENIIAMLETTLSLVLTKKLSLKDHVDLVYEALEKAKIEKFIV